MDLKRRQWLTTACSLGTGVVLLGCNLKSQKDIDEEASEKAGKENAGTEVNAIEDLMREHGVLRRCLLVYQESVAKLRKNAAAVPPDALEKTAKLFQVFGEDYHERKLEETYIFPAIKKAGSRAADYADVLILQHQRGREITDFILAATSGAKISSTNLKSFATALTDLVRMYEHHAAVEDTVVFPAWKQTLNTKQLDEMNEKFEEIEHAQFGENGFEAALGQIEEIERTLGLNDLTKFTASVPASGVAS